MDNYDGYAGSKNAAPPSKSGPSPYANKNAQTASQAKKPPALPEIKFTFFVLSSVTRSNIIEHIKNQISTANAIWRRPEEPTLHKFDVNLNWDDVITGIPDREGTYRRIEYYIDKSEKVLQLIKKNYSNSTSKPEIPVFVAEFGWDQVAPSDKPYDSRLEGRSVVRTDSWFAGEPAIFIFSSQLTKDDTYTLGHELAHIIGGGSTHTHPHVPPENIGASPPGNDVTRAQLVALHRWATEIAYRKELLKK
jgi:hypothetical protein